MYPHLSLTNLPIDQELARRLPRKLAYFHLALPIAQDDDQITVAMAFSDNQTVINILETALQMPIAPVSSSPDEIKAALDHIWGEEGSAPLANVLAWSNTAAQRDSVKTCAETFAPAFSADVTLLDGDHSPLDAILPIAQEGHYKLIVTDEAPSLGLLLHKSPVPVMIARGSVAPPKRALFVLRGHAPDRAALEFVVPLLQFFHARITLFQVARPLSSYLRSGGLPDLLSVDSEYGAHIAACTSLLEAAQVEGTLKLRQGFNSALENDIADEAASGSYDWIAIAAEAYGDFVLRALRAMNTRAPAVACPFLIVKPNLTAAEG